MTKNEFSEDSREHWNRMQGYRKDYIASRDIKEVVDILLEVSEELVTAYIGAII